MQKSHDLFPLCSHFKECSGCSENLTLKLPPVWLEALLFFEGYSITPCLHQGPLTGWRHRAKVAVRGTANFPQIGLFKRASHEVFPIPSCLVHHPKLNQAFEYIRCWIVQHALTPYQEKTGQGDLRYLQGVVHRESGLVQMSFVLNTNALTSKAQAWQQLILELPEQDPSFWHSLWINFNDRPTNTIFGSQWRHVWGNELVWETLDGVQVCFGPASFGQANFPLFEALLMRLRDLVLPNSRVAEFYAGVGVIGLFIASKCEWVRCSEINVQAKACFEQSKQRLPLDIGDKIDFITSPAKEAFSLLEEAETVIVDPPRKGLDLQFFAALKNVKSVKQLLYVSCGWEAFKQDCQQLCADGWTVKNAEGYLFFPGSNHVELLVNFIRKDD